MKRDKKDRFTSESDDNRGYKFTVTFLSITNMVFWAFIIIIVIPWATYF